MKVRKSLEDGTHRIASPFGDLGRRRNARILAQQRQIRVDDQLPRPHAAQSAAVDPGWSRGWCGRQIYQIRLASATGPTSKSD
jgi:hypothetical protein